MPIKVVEGLPAVEKLKAEGVNIIPEERALSQDIRPLRIIILNLMPTKETTETQLLRLIGGSPLQIEVDFLHTASYKSKNISASHLDSFYYTFPDIEDNYYDGLIVTGAPVEHMPFEEVGYYDELVDILKWSEEHVYSRFFICWSAQFALNFYYGIEKKYLTEKLFGVYSYDIVEKASPFLRGFNDFYSIPESRHTTMNADQIDREPDLTVLTKDIDLGPDLVTSSDNRNLFIFGHLEYERYTLELEYKRDLKKGRDTEAPENYYLDNDPSKEPVVRWKSYAYILFNNWVNETYQSTLYDLTQLSDKKSRPVIK